MSARLKLKKLKKEMEFVQQCCRIRENEAEFVKRRYIKLMQENIVDECIREYRGPLSNEMRPYYLKSEADNAIKGLSHNKYKRCLAMVKYCDMGLTYYNEKLDTFSCERADFFYKWYNRWWELAEKFKEAM